MKKIVFYFFVLLLAVWLGVVMRHDPGYVLIAYHNISLETSLWFMVVTLMFLFLFFYAALRFSSGVYAFTSYVRKWISSRRKRRAQSQTVLGLYDFIEGSWWRAEKKLLRSAKHSDMPLVNYLAAAFAADKQHALKRRNNYLYLAQKNIKDRPIAIGLVQASLQIGSRQWEVASITLKHLQHLYPKNVLVLQLLQQVYFELKDWSSLEKLLPILRKRDVFSVDEINQLEQKLYRELLLIWAQNNTIEAQWSRMSRCLQQNPMLVAIYVEYLLTNNKNDEAEAILKIVLRKNLDERLLDLYAKLTSSDTMKHLLRAEKWLKDNPDNASLLLCLGRICKQQKLWGKARHYLEKSVKLKPTLAVYAEFAKIMEMQNDLRGAVEFYDKGMRVAKINS